MMVISEERDNLMRKERRVQDRKKGRMVDS